MATWTCELPTVISDSSGKVDGVTVYNADLIAAIDFHEDGSVTLWWDDNMDYRDLKGYQAQRFREWWTTAKARR